MPGRKDRRSAINRRVKLQDGKLSQEQVLIQLRKERGVGGRRRLFSLQGLRQLRTQSGLTWSMSRFLGTVTGAVALGCAIAAMWFGLPAQAGAADGSGAGRAPAASWC